MECLRVVSKVGSLALKEFLNELDLGPGDTVLVGVQLVDGVKQVFIRAQRGDDLPSYVPADVHAV